MSRGSRHSGEIKRKAALAYLACGSLTETSKTTGIARRTLAGWIKSEWWEQLLTELRQEGGELELVSGEVGEPESAGEAIEKEQVTSHRSVLELVSNQSSHYTDNERRAAVLQYSMLGNMSKVSKALNIPATTLSSWKNSSDWWVSLSAEVRTEKDDAIGAQLDQMIDLAYSETIDRLENGDVVLVKGEEGLEEKRVPMKGKDAAIIGSIGFDKRQLLLHQPTSISGKVDGMDKLLKHFEQLARESRQRIVSEQ